MATTKDLIDRIVPHADAIHAVLKTVVPQFFPEITPERGQGNRPEFRNFGVFETKTTPAGMAQDLRTQERIHVSATHKGVFKRAG